MVRECAVLACVVTCVVDTRPLRAHRQPRLRVDALDHPVPGGRTALLELLPMSIAELRGAGIQGSPAALHYHRDSSGLEVDLLVEYGVPPGHVGLVEIKSGQTYHYPTTPLPHCAATPLQPCLSLTDPVLAGLFGWRHRLLRGCLSLRRLLFLLHLLRELSLPLFELVVWLCHRQPSVRSKSDDTAPVGRTLPWEPTGREASEAWASGQPLTPPAYSASPPTPPATPAALTRALRSGPAKHRPSPRLLPAPVGAPT